MTRAALLPDFTQKIPVPALSAPASAEMLEQRNQAHHDAFYAFLNLQLDKLRSEMAEVKSEIQKLDRMVSRGGDNLQTLIRERDQLAGRERSLLARALEVQAAIRYALDFMNGPHT